MIMNNCVFIEFGDINENPYNKLNKVLLKFEFWNKKNHLYFEILMWSKYFYDFFPNGNKIFFLSSALKYMHGPGLLNTINLSLIVIYFYKKKSFSSYWFVVICNKFLIFCFSNNSSTYDDNDSGVQDTVLTPPTKQYGSYIDGKHPTPPHP